MKTNYELKIIGQRDYTVRFHLMNDDDYLSFREVFELWKSSAEFVLFYKNELIELGFKAFYWEHPALKVDYLDKRYECILQKSRPLEQLPANESAFKDYISGEDGVVDFMNLGKNARLVVPTKKSEEEIYNHFGRFIRFAENQQIIEVFERIGTLIEDGSRQNEIIWLNTAGLGVIWLHVRMDTRPKYYKT